MAGGGEPPAWSATAGVVDVVDGRDLVSVLNGACVVAQDAATGREIWSWAGGNGPSSPLGLAASGGTVVVAMAASRGTAPAMVYSVMAGLVGLDAATGHERWSRTLADDGQATAAKVVGDDVVVTEDDGTVLAVNADSGATLWTDRPPAGCSGGNSYVPGLSPAAAFLPGGRSATVVYQCKSGPSQIADISPASGAVDWSWTAPSGWSVDTRAPAGFSSGVVAVIVSERAPATDSATANVVAVDESTGRILWQANETPSSAGIYAGAGQICVAATFGVQCQNARTGALSWTWHPVATPGQGGPGEYFGGVVADSGRLYLVAPAQTSISPSPAGAAFDLMVLDMATGKVIDDRPLPAYNGGPEVISVSVDSPPGVLAVAPGEVFVSPQFRETPVVEAFPR